MARIWFRLVLKAVVSISFIGVAGFIDSPDAFAKKKYRYGERYKKRNKKSLRGSTCIPCAGKNRQCEKRINETHCKACNAFREAWSDYAKYRRRSPSIAMQALVEVNHTAITRSKSGIYPRNICSVIHQPYQFSWTLCPKTCVNDRDWAIVMKAAKAAKTSNGKMNYHAAYVNPGWARNCKGRNRIGTHIYYNNCTGGKLYGSRKKRASQRKQRNWDRPKAER